MENRPTLCVAAICQNEEEDLPYFLENLLLWVDEIVLIDDFSTDNTVSIAKNAGRKVKVIQQKMNPDKGYAGQRNLAIEQAQSDWLLHMDIDERVTAELAQEIRSSIATNLYNGFRYRRLNFFLHRPIKAGGLELWNNPQLARKGKHHFENAIHESCVIEGDIGQLKNRMWHLNDVDYHERSRKSLKYSEIEAAKILKTGKIVYAYHLIFLPIIYFLKVFILRKGFLDGTLGLIFALHSSTAIFRAYALVWDSQNRIARSSLEKRLQDTWRTRWEKKSNV